MKLSQEKKDKISEQILSCLYHSNPKTLFTAQIARDIARDEEFIKALLQELEKKGLVISVRKNKNGTLFSRRIRWQLSQKAYQAYKSI